MIEKQSNELYTTVTVSDFEDAHYIQQLMALDSGLELALLTKLSDLSQCKRDFELLKKEITEFCHCFDQFNIPKHIIRIHQPGGYTYHWYDNDGLSGFYVLRDFFDHCYDLGFRNYIIHTPYGNSDVEQGLELGEYREKLASLVPDANLEVEEIAVSNDELKDAQEMRFYSGDLFEKLMKDQKATMLLDTYECGGVNETVRRFDYLTSKGFEIHSMHMHKEKHKFLTADEVKFLITSGFRGRLINEGFLKHNSSFDEFVKTKSLDCVMPNAQRITLLEEYKKQLSLPVV